MNFDLALRRARLLLGHAHPLGDAITDPSGYMPHDISEPQPAAFLKPALEPRAADCGLGAEQGSSSGTVVKAEGSASAQVHPPKAVRIFQKFRPLPVVVDVDPDRNKAIALWGTIVSSCPDASVLGRQLSQASDEMCTQIMKDAFGKKATATLRSRAGSILGYIRWGKATFLVFVALPLQESHCYEYVCFLRATNAPPSRAERFVQAVRFTHTILGIDGPLCAISARVSGATTVDVPRRALIKKLPFTAAQVRKFEVVACDDPSADSIFAGFVCLLIYGRIRFSDAQMTYKEPVLQRGDGGNLLELELYGSKTMSTRRSSVFRLLPVVATSPGLRDECWASKWMDNRKRLGLCASEDEPLMRCPSADGDFGPKKLGTSDACVWIRELLQGVSPEENLSDFGTHSSKATILSWLAKSNAAPKLQRRAGYHVGKHGRSELEYSHDAVAPVAEKVRLLVHLVREKLFNPDAPRLQRWDNCDDFDDAVRKLKLVPKIPKRSTADHVSELLRSSSSEEETSESGAESTDSERDRMQANVAAQKQVEPSNMSDGYIYFQHHTRNTVHRAKRESDEDITVFACGRLPSQNHRKLASRPRVILQGCAACFRIT